MMRLMRNARPSRQDRDVTEDLWLRDVARIPTAYGRLVYLSALRDPNTGRYEHYGIGPGQMAVANRSLKRIHELIFTEWVGLTLERKMADLEQYISGLPDQDRGEIVDAWLRLTPYKNLVPASIQGPERRRHESDFEAMLGLLKNVYGVASPDPTA